MEVHQQSMPLLIYHQDLCDLFDRGDHPNIFPYEIKGEMCLDTIEPGPHNTDESIKAMFGIMDALIYLKTHQIDPCQIRLPYVIRKNKVWGLRHAICERNSEQQKDQNSYNPKQFHYHRDSENQLMWNLGKIWLRFFTKTEILIKNHRQECIHEVIDKRVPQEDIALLIKKMLTTSRSGRMTFDQFLDDDFFINQDKELSKTNFSSFSIHFKLMSRMGKLQTLKGILPFEKEARYRYFHQYLEVDLLFENVCREIRSSYMTGRQNQRAACQFSLYLIRLQNFLNMMEVNRFRLEMGQAYQDLVQRLHLSKITNRIIMLRELLQKTARSLRTNQNLRVRYKQLFKPVDELNQEVVYNEFRKCLNEYLDYLAQDYRAEHDISLLRLIIKIYLVRTSKYVFLDGRSTIFEPFLRINREFKIKRVLQAIYECEDHQKMKELMRNIRKFYF